MSAIRFSLKSTRTAGSWPRDDYEVSAGVLAELPDGAGFGTCAFVVNFSGAPAGTITPRLLGSIDGLLWYDITGATIAAQAADTPANTAEVGGVGSTQLVDFGVTRFVRLAVAETGGPPLDGSVVDVTVNIDL